MQKDYLRRTSENNPDTKSKPAKHPILHSYLPSRSSTAGSIKDNSGAEVTSDRVILYIHGTPFWIFRRAHRDEPADDV
jgi:hypothetical protein